MNSFFLVLNKFGRFQEHLLTQYTQKLFCVRVTQTYSMYFRPIVCILISGIQSKYATHQV